MGGGLVDAFDRIDERYGFIEPDQTLPSRQAMEFRMSIECRSQRQGSEVGDQISEIGGRRSGGTGAGVCPRPLRRTHAVFATLRLGQKHTAYGMRHAVRRQGK